MSGHFSQIGGFPTGPQQGFHKLSTKRWLFLISTPIPATSRLALVAIAASCLCNRPFAAGQGRLGQMLSRSERHIRRVLALLEAQGLIRIVRRGRRLTNIYLLRHWLWEKLTGHKVRNRSEDRQTRFHWQAPEGQNGRNPARTGNPGKNEGQGGPVR